MTHNVAEYMNDFLSCCEKCNKLIPFDVLGKHEKTCVPKTCVPKVIVKISSDVVPKVPVSITIPETNKRPVLNYDPEIPKVVDMTKGSIDEKKKIKTKKVPKDKNKINPIDQLDLDMDQIQIDALRWCFLKAKIYHKNVYPNSVIRFLEMGLNEQDLTDTIDYIKNIDAIVHFGRDQQHPVPWLSNEDFLKNTFEVYGGGNYTDDGVYGGRMDWENNLFNKIYKQSCDHKLRVKYGCLNLMSDARGCGSAAGYGRSYMILKPEVKKRTTFVSGDSCQKQTHICTFEHFVQLILYLDEATLRNVISMAKFIKGKTHIRPDVNNLYNYVEIQIHGDVQISRDVEHIMMYRPNIDAAIIHRLKRDGIPYTIFD